MLTWQEIVLLNKRITNYSVIKFLNDARILPGTISIENYEDMAQRIVVLSISHPAGRR